MLRHVAGYACLTDRTTGNGPPLRHLVDTLAPEASTPTTRGRGGNEIRTAGTNATLIKFSYSPLAFEANVPVCLAWTVSAATIRSKVLQADHDLSAFYPRVREDVFEESDLIRAICEAPSEDWFMAGVLNGPVVTHITSIGLAELLQYFAVRIPDEDGAFHSVDHPTRISLPLTNSRVEQGHAAFAIEKSSGIEWREHAEA